LNPVFLWMLGEELESPKGCKNPRHF